MTAAARKSEPVLVVGLGATGLSCARFFDRAGEPFEVADNRTDPPGLAAFQARWPDVPISLGPFDARRFARARRIVMSPGVSPHDPVIAAAAQAGVECIGDIELFARAADAPVIAVTGSNGKSTVTTMVGVLLEAAGYRVRVGGNLGPPALDLLADDAESPDFYVLELSSFQLETTFSLQAVAATVLNVSADHMDRYRSLAEYAAAKGRIYNGARTAVVNRDDPGAARLANRVAHEIGFTVGEPAEDDFGVIEREGGLWLSRGNVPLLDAERLPLAGAHNRANALAALALVSAVGVEPVTVAPALSDFEGLPHRTRLVAELDGVRWYDDSKGTNVGATAAALDGMDRPVVLIAGGDAKDADFSPLRAAVERRARAVVLMGRDAPLLAAALEGAAPIEYADDLDAAVTRAAGLARSGDAVLLSPACASFDMFRDYHERGDMFVAAVHKRGAA
ncbi:MAG: UDP-N-acetylmuramoyl-L-alanine--D-glutamate ligase [Halofilum sp. (in: g-proteobacteria)]